LFFWLHFIRVLRFFKDVDDIIRDIEENKSKHLKIHKNEVTKSVVEEAVQTDSWFPSRTLHSPSLENLHEDEPKESVKPDQGILKPKIKFLCSIQYNSLEERTQALHRLLDISNNTNHNQSKSASNEEYTRKIYRDDDVESSQIVQLEEISKLRREIMSKFKK